jgi:hypothetical protein
MITAFWDATPCSLVRSNQRSSEPLPHDTVSQTIVTPARTQFSRGYTRSPSSILRLSLSCQMSLGSVRKCWLAIRFVVFWITTARCSLIGGYQRFRAASSTLKTEAVCFSETVVPTTRCHYAQGLCISLIPQILQVHHK